MQRTISTITVLIYIYAGYFLQIDCGKAEEGLKTTPCSECTQNMLVIWKS